MENVGEIELEGGEREEVVAVTERTLEVSVHDINGGSLAAKSNRVMFVDRLPRLGSGLEGTPRPLLPRCVFYGRLTNVRLRRKRNIIGGMHLNLYHRFLHIANSVFVSSLSASYRSHSSAILQEEPDFKFFVTIIINGLMDISVVLIDGLPLCFMNRCLILSLSFV
ncbi:hypothetical protein GQ457_13G006440 [Hibiscus cannabinus]